VKLKSSSRCINVNYESLEQLQLYQGEFFSKSALCVRGGGDSEEEEEEEYDEEVTEELSNDESVLVSLTKKSLYLVGKISLRTILAMQRATKAGIETAFSSATDVESEGEESSSSSFISKLSTIVNAMWKAALNNSVEDTNTDTSTIAISTKKEKLKDTTNTNIKDMGDYLASTYKTASATSSSTAILGGSLSDALRTCRSQARLLVAFIPASKPNSSKSKTAFDVTCIDSLRSDEVAQAIQAKKGSYVLWAAKYGSPEAIQAAKRLRTSHAVASSKKNLPTLVVAYPSQVSLLYSNNSYIFFFKTMIQLSSFIASQVLDKKSGKIKIHPKLLAQHHCNPPPNPTTFASFLKALRKRHSSHIKSMRAQLREAELHAERKSNYAQSMQLDSQREEKEAKAQAEETARLEEEKDRIRKLKERRQAFLKALGEEPEAEEKGVVTVALRLADGRNAQRRFGEEENMEIIFNWVDALFEWDRELVQVTTMRGDNKLEWSDSSGSTIGEYAGSNTKMLGLRISLKKEDIENEKEEGDEIEAATESS